MVWGAEMWKEGVPRGGALPIQDKLFAIALVAEKAGLVLVSGRGAILVMVSNFNAAAMTSSNIL